MYANRLMLTRRATLIPSAPVIQSAVSSPESAGGASIQMYSSSSNSNTVRESTAAPTAAGGATNLRMALAMRANPTEQGGLQKSESGDVDDPMSDSPSSAIPTGMEDSTAQLAHQQQRTTADNTNAIMPSFNVRELELEMGDEEEGANACHKTKNNSILAELASFGSRGTGHTAARAVNPAAAAIAAAQQPAGPHEEHATTNIGGRPALQGQETLVTGWSVLPHHINRNPGPGAEGPMAVWGHGARLRVHVASPVNDRPYSMIRFVNAGPQGDGQFRLCMKNISARGFIYTTKNLITREWVHERQGGALVAIKPSAITANLLPATGD